MFIEDLLVFFRRSSSETVAQRCSVKEVFLEISQNSQENTCAWVSFFKIHRCFPVNFAKFLRIPFFNRTPVVAASGSSVHNGLRKNKNSSWYLHTIRKKNFEMAHQKQQIKSASKYILKGSNRRTRKKCEIDSKLTKKTPQRRQWRRSDVFFVLLLILDK